MITNKTLADVQPGGRVRLGDRAERARFEEWYVQNAFDYEANPIGSRDCALMRKAWNAALSAPPSPGGQGDALATLIDQWMARADRHEASALEADSIGGMQMAVAVHEARAAELNAAVHSLKEALAARQPVGEPVAYTSEAQLNAVRVSGDGIMSQRNAKWRIPLYAAPPAQAVSQDWHHIANEWADAATNGVQWLRNIRDGASTVADALACMESNVERIQQIKPQPVGGAVAYWLAVDKDGIVEFGMSADDGNAGQAARQEVNDFINGPLHDGGVPHRLVGVYTAPPAQAVDLEQFRPAVCAMGLYAEEPEDVDEAKRLLALIDSQAVGK
ncbi:hypothetical protein I5U86_00565 [Stenotrophomonas maltophilia]|nr:hypothetical protein [Stenotrophomonas maltophilia]MBH1706197.1 hypothetical protein [Stenotrophomonas maltophilia]MBH1847047.1 hypothetical protein [Stenotrophomonas maltophilia]